MHMMKLIGKETFTILRTKIVFILSYVHGHFVKLHGKQDQTLLWTCVAGAHL